ncbi:hypothetical protein KEC55_19195 [Burkholderia cepacia]|uniref:hypothetical protein n=1 Tax=Burkholderia cepacia TaxID=292 RepID=UPI00249E5F9B|nr:hypothetical protein [Burkholderia cepacia]WGY71942.1 hypothetical protein KEC55_19195 [Burkholderia cepacia]
MKRLYARLVMWLARPVLDYINERNAALCSRIDAARSDAINNAAAIADERNARQVADAALKMQIPVQPREF